MEENGRDQQTLDGRLSGGHREAATGNADPGLDGDRETPAGVADRQTAADAGALAAGLLVERRGRAAHLQLSAVDRARPELRHRHERLRPQGHSVAAEGHATRADRHEVAVA